MNNKLNMNELKNCVGGFTPSPVVLITGLNSPNGTHLVHAPLQALPGAINAFTKVIQNVPGGDIKNLAVPGFGV